MIVSLTIKNILSFRDETFISFEAGKEKLNSSSLAVVKKLHKKINSLECIFGPNASGKSNLFKVIGFIKNLVLRRNIPGSLTGVIPFRLDLTHPNENSYFKIEFIVTNDWLYSYEVTLNSTEIIEEILSFRNSQGCKLIYKRENSNIKFFDIGKILGTKKTLINIIKTSVQANQLVLNFFNSINLNEFAVITNAYNWFKKIILITPDEGFLPFLSKDNMEQSVICGMLREYGVNIDKIKLIDYPKENLPVPLQEQLKDLPATECIGGITNDKDFVIAYIKDGALQTKKICTLHNTIENKLVSFDFSSESDGTKRLIELSPILLALTFNSKKGFIFLIDEIDRSLHTVLTKTIIKRFLAKRNNDSRIQMVITCHDALMIDPKTFRLDQMWICSKDDETKSSLFRRMNEIPGVRTDKDLLKYYLEGKLGGIPKLQ